MVAAIAALAGGCQDIGNAYHNIGSASQTAIENAYRAAYQVANQGAHAYQGAYMSVYDALFGAPPAAVDFRGLETPAPAAGPLVANRIVVLKSQRLLVLEFNDKVVRTYPIALGPDALGRKREQGDGRTPEGEYAIDWKTADTRYTRELHISYPDAADRAWADEHHVSPGGAIFVHGLPLDYGPYDPPVWLRDWTEGCIAVGNAAVKTIYDAVPDGTPIDILP